MVGVQGSGENKGVSDSKSVWCVESGILYNRRDTGIVCDDRTLTYGPFEVRSGVLLGVVNIGDPTGEVREGVRTVSI